MTAPEHFGTLAFNQPSNPPSENEARRRTFGSRGGAIGFSKKLKEWKEVAFYAWKQERNGPIGKATSQPCEVVITLQFRGNHRRDPHNYTGTVCKSIIDGLVLASLWPDDTPEWLTLREPVLSVVKAPPQMPLVCAVDLYRRG